MIRADLTASPFQGEAHRKVWARLRVRDGVKVGRRRVLKLMWENNLLFPYRGRRGNPRLHAGEIITPAPNLMWGTDGAKLFTVEEGWGWFFIAVEHWNAECMGWHVCKLGTRFAAPEPISQGLMTTAGSVAADAAGACLCGWTTAPSTCRIIFRTRPPLAFDAASEKPYLAKTLAYHWIDAWWIASRLFSSSR